MKYYIRLLLFSLGLALLSACQTDDVLTIRADQYGAVGDGVTLNTEVLQRAIDELSDHGGGRLLFTRGKYLTGSLLLRSNIEIRLDEGATLLGSTNPYDYIDLSEEKGAGDNSTTALILASKCHNIRFSGRGNIDGQGRELALNVDSLHHIGELIDQHYNTRRNYPNETARPKLFYITECDSVFVDDLTLGNSACWGLSFDRCHHLRLTGITVHNRVYWNNDGTDMTDCHDVIVRNCQIHSGDDGICLKSYHPDMNQDILIEDCVVSSSSNAIKLGTASWGGFRNITIRNITVFDTFRSAVAVQCVDGGTIDNVLAENIKATNVGSAFFVRLGHRNGDKPGSLSNVTFRNFDVSTVYYRPDIMREQAGPDVGSFHNPFPLSICGLPDAKISNVTAENIRISYPGRATKGMAYIGLYRVKSIDEKADQYPEYSMFGELPSWAFYVRHVDGLNLSDIHLELRDTDFRPAFVFDDVQRLQLSNIQLPEGMTLDSQIFQVE